MSEYVPNDVSMSEKEEVFYVVTEDSSYYFNSYAIDKATNNLMIRNGVSKSAIRTAKTVKSPLSDVPTFTYVINERQWKLLRNTTSEERKDYLAVIANEDN